METNLWVNRQVDRAITIGPLSFKRIPNDIYIFSESSRLHSLQPSSLMTLKVKVRLIQMLKINITSNQSKLFAFNPYLIVSFVQTLVFRSKANRPL